MVTYSITRYRTKGLPAQGLTDDNLTARLSTNAFHSIDSQPLEEDSLGWVEMFNHHETNFNPATYRFGDLMAFALRYDSRKVSAKTLNRYYAIGAHEHQEKTGRRPNSLARKEIKEAVYGELMAKAAVETEVLPTIWFRDTNEVWFLGQGTKKRELFEALWSRTFDLPLKMAAPFVIAESFAKHKAHKLPHPFELERLNIQGDHFLDRWASSLHLGQEFLLWLWAESEIKGNVMTASDKDIEIQFVNKMALAKDKDKVSCSSDTTSWPETYLAILEGKKISSAGIKIKTENNGWTFILDADTLMPKSVKMNKSFSTDSTEEDDSMVGALYETIGNLGELVSLLDILFTAFTAVRGSSLWASRELPRIIGWVRDQHNAAHHQHQMQYLNNLLDKLDGTAEVVLGPADSPAAA